MPTIFTENGYRFFVYSNDHDPIHVHVRKGGGEAVFNVEGDVELRESVGMKTKDLTQAEEIACRRQQEIINYWNDYFEK
jgi:hypothetical protein